MSTLSLPANRVDANGTTWRLRSLFAMGHGRSRIARALEVSGERIDGLVSGGTKTVTPELKARADALWAAWWCFTAPERDRDETRSARYARRLAKRNDWPAPLGLDEPDYATGDLGLDAPGYRPYCHYRPATGCGVAPDFGSVSEPLSARRSA